MVVNENENEIEYKDLLTKIDIPFFNNNLEYINLWIKYYQTTKDIGILFLMKYKKISNDYYWLYFEMANFYKKKGKEGLSVYILQKGIENKVYKNEILIENLKNYEKIEPVTENYAHKYLYPKGFKALGRTWNEFINVNYCKEGILKNGNVYISLEEYRFISRSNWEFKREDKVIYFIKKCIKIEKVECMKSEGVNDKCINTEEVIDKGINDNEFKEKAIENKEIEFINLKQFLKSLNCSPKEQSVILEFCLLQILIYIKKNNQIVDFENLTLNQNFEINFNWKNVTNALQPIPSNLPIIEPQSLSSLQSSTLPSPTTHHSPSTHPPTSALPSPSTHPSSSTQPSPSTHPPTYALPSPYSSTDPFSHLFIFFDQLSNLKILSKDLLQSFDDLNVKIHNLKVKFSLKENIFIINKFKILLIEKFYL